jgi:hypothetical protein
MHDKNVTLAELGERLVTLKQLAGMVSAMELYSSLEKLVLRRKPRARLSTSSMSEGSIVPLVLCTHSDSCCSRSRHIWLAS